MILCEPISLSQTALDGLAVLVSQLAGRGYPVAVRHDLVTTPGLHRNQAFDLLSHAVDLSRTTVSAVLLTCEQALADKDLIALRGRKLPRDVPHLLVGHFPTAQDLVAARAKLGYILDVDAQVHSLSEASAIPIFGAPSKGAPSPLPRILLVDPPVGDEGQARFLQSMTRARSCDVALLLSGKEKAAWQSRFGTDLPAWHWGEVPPLALAGQTDVAIFFAVPAGHRPQSYLANLFENRVLAADATPGKDLAALGVRLLAPCDIATLLPWIETTLVPNIAALTEEAYAATRPAVSDFLSALETLPAGRAAPRARPAKSGIAFMPTNGVGLGHAQRCSLIADHLAERAHFLAFPSCLKMLELSGNRTTPLVSRSDAHLHPHANDLVNAARIEAVAREKALFVFDGGYVFDSVVRTAVGTGTPCVWIRRGLWQAGQDNRIALDREKVFARTIVPLEVFEELNVPVSRQRNVIEVNPIVNAHRLDEDDRSALRARLADRFGPYEKLVVTMLGGGVAADRSAHLATLCALMERQEDTLHLVITWPTAKLPATATQWSRTRVVKTHFAATLVDACDLYVSAAGYNSFHESMYRAIPTLFLPQMSAFMDDQAARARAAESRGLAMVADPEKPLTLSGQIHELLRHDGAEAIRRALQAQSFPEPGQREAARILEEMTG